MNSTDRNVMIKVCKLNSNIINLLTFPRWTVHLSSKTMHCTGRTTSAPQAGRLGRDIKHALVGVVQVYMIKQNAHDF